MVRIALALWIAWAVVVWNVVFDHVIVVSGREYLAAVAVAALRGGPYPRMDDWMRPGAARAAWIASASAASILASGVIAISYASKRARTRGASEPGLSPS
jgi:hypothetical protein